MMNGRRHLLFGVMVLEGIGILAGLIFVFYLFFDSQTQQRTIRQLDEAQKEAEEDLILSTNPTQPSYLTTQMKDTPALFPAMEITISATITPTIQVEREPFIHIVAQGETLSAIAMNYEVDIEEILEENPWIKNPDHIQPGDQVIIPGLSYEFEDLVGLTENGTRPYTSLPSLITSDPNVLASAYPLLGYAAEGNLILHYQPGAYVDQNENQVKGILTEAYLFVEDALGTSLETPLDIYLAGSLFQNQENLRGFTQSGMFRSYLLVDGTGTLGEQTYLFAHEFTHIFAYHHWGKFHSPMVHEGLATYLPQQFLEDRTDNLPLDEICAAMKAADRLEPITSLAGQKGYGPPYFEGHIRSFLYYNQSACFVKFLLEVYGIESFSKVFHTGDYVGVYDQNLGELDQRFRANLDGISLNIDPFLFVSTIDSVATAYDDYFSRTSAGRHANFQAYLTLDTARLAVNSGDLTQATQLVSEYYQMVDE